MSERCSNCRYYGEDPERDPEEMGECRYNPPTHKGWPNVLPDDWCREYSEKENNNAVPSTEPATTG